MNRNYLIAIVIAAAALIAYFILSSPSESDKSKTTDATGGLPGIPGDTTSIPGASANNPLSDLLSGVISNQQTNSGTVQSSVIGRRQTSAGWVTLYGHDGTVDYLLIESTNQKLVSGTDGFSKLWMEIAAQGKINVGHGLV